MAVDITAVKPASQPGNPSWATNGGTRVAPTLGQKQSGWTDGQRPPFNVFNWLLGFLSDWSKYGEDSADQLDAKKLSVNGANHMDADLTPTADNAVNLGDLTHRWVSGFAYVFNAATAFVVGATMQLTDKLLKLAATADVATTARTNTLTSRSMIKAWGSVQANAGVVTLLDGFNIAAQAVGTSGKAIKITMASAIADHNKMCVVVSMQTGVQAFLKTPQSLRPVGGLIFEIEGRDAGGTEIDLAGGTTIIDFAVWGIQ